MRVCDICKRCYPDAESTCVTDGHPRLADVVKGDPEMIDGVRIEYFIDRTGPLQKFRANQIETGRDCTISIVTLPENTRKQFLDEAAIAASIIHPAFETVYGSGVTEPSDVFVISGFSDAPTLRDVLTETAVPQLLNTIKIIRQVAEAVEILHSNGLVHGAIRPENVLIAKSDSDIKLQSLDFAGAIRNSIVSDKFNIDSSVEKLQYFAPEQFSNEANSPSSDIYSLGVVLFELLSGSPPFTADNAAELIEKHRTEHPPDIKIANYELRMLLANILMESLQKQPSLRLPSAQAFARQMRHIEQLATHSSTPPPVMAVKPKARSAAASASPQPPAQAPRFIKETPVSKLGLTKELDQRVLQAVPKPTAKVEAEQQTIAVPASTQIDAEDDLNKLRLNYWKEKYNKQIGSPTAKKNASGRWDSVLNLEPPVETPGSKLPVTKPSDKAKGFDAAPAAKKTRIKVEWQQPEEDLPSMDTVRTMVASSPVIEEEKLENEVGPLASKSKSETTISLPKTKSAEMKKRQAARAPMYSIMAVAAEATASTLPPSEAAIFSTSGSRPNPRSLDTRVVVAGIAAVFVVAVLFAASFLGSEETSIQASIPEPPAQAASGTATELQSEAVQSGAAAVESHSELNADDYALAPETREESIAPTVRTANVAKDTRKDSVVKSPSTPAADTTKTVKDVRADIVTATKAAPLNPSTLVIFSDKGKVSKRVEDSNGSSSPRSPGKSASGNGASRPRIVSNPKP